MKLYNYLFPFKLHLTILQLEEYRPSRFLKWFLAHPLTRSLPVKKPLLYTPKTNLIIFLSAIWLLLLTIPFPLAPVILLTNPFLLFFLALFTLKPYEIINKRRTLSRTRTQILSHPKLKVVGITGSYAKTSVKEILFQLLSRRYKVLRTPESFNTVFGIAKVVNYELNPSHQFFLCELGAYHRGEIRQLCRMVNPSFGIITGITKQHLERFRTFSNIILTKFELLDYLRNPSKIVFNLADSNISTELARRNLSSSSVVSASNIRLDSSGTRFTLTVNRHSYPVSTPLFGFQNVQNILLASDAALKLGLTPKELLQQISSLKPISNRFTLTHSSSTTIVNNTYNSSPASFLQMLASAKAVRGRKALLTPGVVELGKEAIAIHHQLGQKSCHLFDQIILVGKNTRTKAFAAAFSQPKSVTFIPDDRTAYQESIQSLIKKRYDWIFLENDLTQNY